MSGHRVFAALSDPTRLRVLSALAHRGPATATQLAVDLPVSRQAIAKHLDTLDGAGLVSRQATGREVKYQFEPGPLEGLASWVSDTGDTWENRLKRLGRAFD